MIGQGTLVSELQSIVGKEYAREPPDSAAYSVDGLVPTAVVEPDSYEEVAEVIRFANSERLAIVPMGGGSSTHLGNAPSRYDIALRLVRLDRMVEHEPADLTATCQAAITIGDLGKQLSSAGQIVPLCMESVCQQRTAGALLSLNMGHVRAAYGAPRDFTIGLKVVTGDGRVNKAGGKVVKNVAGYDLCKLYIGSRGTLGVIVEATFKLYPQPQTRQQIWSEFANCADACRAARDVYARGLTVVSSELARSPEEMDRHKGGSYLLGVNLAGETKAVERSLQQARTIAIHAGGKPYEDEPGEPSQGHWPLNRLDTRTGVRVSLLPTLVPVFITQMEKRARGLFQAAPLLGEVLWTWADTQGERQRIDSARAVAMELGGTLEVEVCSPELKREIDVFGPTPASFPLMSAVKRQFDPNNVLSPGRFVGRL